MSKGFFLRYQTFKISFGFDQNWPYNRNISVKLKQKRENLSNIAIYDEMVPSQFFLLNEVKILFVSLMRKKFQMESFWNVFETVTKVSKENGFHGNLVTKHNKCDNCLSRISLYTFIR